VFPIFTPPISLNTKKTCPIYDKVHRADSNGKKLWHSKDGCEECPIKHQKALIQWSSSNSIFREGQKNER
jgi:hypothetical protein